jgi:hypothetical protein
MTESSSPKQETIPQLLTRLEEAFVKFCGGRESYETLKAEWERERSQESETSSLSTNS